MSKCVFPKKPPAMKPQSDYSPSLQGLTKGNGKQPYKVLKMSLERNIMFGFVCVFIWFSAYLFVCLFVCLLGFLSVLINREI